MIDFLVSEDIPFVLGSANELVWGVNYFTLGVLVNTTGQYSLAACIQQCDAKVTSC